MPSSEDLMKAKDFLSEKLLRTGGEETHLANAVTFNLNKAIENAKNNVHAIGVGKKILNGKVTPAICIFVTQKIHLSLLPKEYLLPKTVHGIPTDVIQSPPAFLKPALLACTNDRQNRQRPMIGGISIGHKDVTFGTIGYFCRSLKKGDDNGKIYVLSNNHVLANTDLGNTDLDNVPGDNIYQPGPNGGGLISDNVAATLHRKVRLNFSQDVYNKVDVAIGEILPDVLIEERICQIGKIKGTSKSKEDMIVIKHGAMSGFTEGKVTHEAMDAIITVEMDGDSNLKLKFKNQIRIERISPYPYFGTNGDSGSLVVNKENNEAVGLFFAGPQDDSYSYANQIDDVLKELEIQLL